MPSVRSISTAYSSSRSLRATLRSLPVNSVRASCWVMVLAPRSLNASPSSGASTRAISVSSKPTCSSKRWSSAAITAAGSSGPSASRLTQLFSPSPVKIWRGVPSAWRQASAKRPYRSRSVPMPLTSNWRNCNEVVARSDGSASRPCACSVPLMAAVRASGTASASAR